MERRLQSRHYTSLDEFVRDMQLVFDNCRLYNQETTPYYKCANTVERDFRVLLKEVGWAGGNGGASVGGAGGAVQT